MKKVYTFLTLLLLSNLYMYARQQDEPIITITTRLTEGTGYSFYIYYYTDELEADAEAGILEADYGHGKVRFPVVNGSWVKSTISGNVGSEGIVRVYGDSRFIQGFDSSNDPNYPVTAIELSRCTNLTHLFLENNKIQELDLSNQGKLVMISLLDNTFSRIPDFSNNPELKDLNIRYNRSMINPVVNFSQLPSIETLELGQNEFKTITVDSPTLKNLYLYGNPLETIDISKAPELQLLDLSTHVLTELDVSKNSKLISLSCDRWDGKGYLRSLDISNNSLLEKLSIIGNKITELDLSHTPNLTYLSCAENQLTELDISMLVHLQTLVANENQLSSLDISSNPVLTSLNIRKNNFLFSTLPRLQEGSRYDYTMQARMEIIQDRIVGGHSIDLTSEWFVEDMESEFTWYQGHPAYGYKILEKEINYTVNEGITQFIELSDNEIFCTITNAYFPGLTITTNPVIIQPLSVEEKTSEEITVWSKEKEIHMATPYAAEAILYSISGSLLHTLSIEPGETTISVNIPGIYMVRLNTEKNYTTHKVVVN